MITQLHIAQQGSQKNVAEIISYSELFLCSFHDASILLSGQIFLKQ